MAADPKRALALYRKACDLDEPHACVNLASRYLRGQDVPADEVEAKRLYKKACVLGDDPSCAWLKKQR